MARDYAKKATRRKKAKSKRGLWVSTILLMAALLLGLMVLNHTPTKTKHIASKPKLNTPKLPHRTHPRFEFYTLLPKTETHATPTTKPIKIEHHLYTLKVASVRNEMAADRLKARLTLLGFNVHITTFNHHHRIWHRISIGPFTTLASAEQAQDQLRRRRIDSLLVKMKKE